MALSSQRPVHALEPRLSLCFFGVPADRRLTQRARVLAASPHVIGA
ncbi:hypothetical protein CEV33_4901 [Brucella grignonensis]|uniref:Uncharacterized protein n=1 Tax=Brucella grignonensis TaxID=94627 RepID=A0A256FTA9_9HYPH|nr:hypothetical protein CEV33_4901 [Brucella grignonensis]